jgi:hypothetical protein
MGLSASALAIVLPVPAPRVNDIVREPLQPGYDLIATAASGKRVLREVRPHAA